MKVTVEVALAPVAAADPARVKKAAERAAGWALGRASGMRVEHRSIDARGREVRLRLRVALSDEGPIAPPEIRAPRLRDVRHAPRALVIGCGPAGMFAALRLIELGVRPVLLERGKDVRARRHDLAAITQRHVVDPDSNYCFGEGGAGTFSDGKLYTRAHKRGDVAGVLHALVAFGASPDILVDAHPHIGTNKLPDIVTRMREAIVASGGEVRFGARVTELVLDGGRVRGVRLASGELEEAERVVLATGHSARDVFELLVRAGVAIERKDFALGVRLEHPQELIDRVRYRRAPRDPRLPPASYSAVTQIRGAGVYTFCMCPGGVIAPCATSPDEVVTNGWSPSKRNNPFANSGVVVEIKGPQAGGGPLSGVRLQRELEHAAWIAGGRTQAAPAQRMVDFMEGRASSTLPACSYLPGVVSHRVDQLLPADITERLQLAMRDFGQKLRGYVTNEAVVVAVESRTSSPVRVPRDPERLEHPDVRGLFPCGEGAGYAGGIVSAAMDGVRVAERVAALLTT